MQALPQRCIWDALTPNRPATKPLSGETTADVCIVGGGITGLSAALHLAERGRSVCVLEGRDVGHGGSGRNVGLVNAGMWIPPDDVEQTLGPAIGGRLNKALAEAPALVFALIERYGLDCQATRNGTLHIAPNRAGLADLTRRFEQWQRRGAPVELLTGASAQQAVGSARVHGALLDRRAGTINPLAYTCGLAAAVIGQGGRVFSHSPVRQLQRRGEHWCVVASGGQVIAPRVILASNAYSQGDWNPVRGQFFAAHYFQVASVPMPAALAAEVLPDIPGAWDTRTVLSSVRKSADNRLILGSLGDGEAAREPLVRSWATRIQRHYFPHLGKLAWECTWSGRIGFTPDHLMRLTEPAEGLLAVAGYNGRGNTTGTVIGKAFADYLIDGDPDALPLPVAPAKPVRAAALRGFAYDAAFGTYHLGQLLRIVS